MLFELWQKLSLNYLMQAKAFMAATNANFPTGQEGKLFGKHRTSWKVNTSCLPSATIFQSSRAYLCMSCIAS